MFGNPTSTTLSALLFLALLLPTPPALAEQDFSWRSFEAGPLVSTHNLEGPAATGFDEFDAAGNEIEGENKTGLGLFVRGRQDFGRWWHVTVDGTYERVAGDVDLFRGSVLPGAHWQATPRLALYAEIGLHAVSVSGLESYGSRRDGAVGDGGSDVAFGGQAGACVRLAPRWEAHVSAGTFNFGREDYPAGFDQESSPGDGPLFELGVHAQLRDRLGLSATWQGTWIEDGAHAIDLATQQVRVGARWTY